MLFIAIALSLTAAPAKSQALLDKGKTSFMTNCMACHGEKGAGDGPGAVALNPKPRNFSKDPFKQGDKPDDVFNTLAKGVPGTPMVAFGHLPEEERWALVYWVLELKGVSNSAPATVDAGSPSKSAQPAKGAQPAKKK